MTGSGAFVYLLEEDAVLAILPGWPAGMQVAVCLSDKGGCDLAVHHRDEVARVLERVAQLHGWKPEDFCVAPEVAGYPTRKVLFSEEQQLLSVVAESPQLVELASDYALNYRFALDEGLDADLVTGMKQEQFASTESVPQTMGGPDTDGVTTPEMSSRARAFITHLSLPSGYAAPSPAQRLECAFADAHMRRMNGRVQLIVGPDDVTGQEVPVQVERIGYRDDFARFVLPRSVLDGWSRGQAAILDMSEDMFPEAVIARFMQVPHRCDVTITVRGVFVSPVRPADEPQTVHSGTVTPATLPRPRVFKTLHLAVAALVAVMVVTGHFAAALDRTPGTVTPALQSADGATVALDLIAVMAQDDRTN